MIDRLVTVAVLLLGAVLLTASLFFSWCAVPSGPLLELKEAPPTPIFRYLSIGALLLLVLASVRFLCGKSVELRSLSLGMLFVIIVLGFYPYLVVNWCPDFSGDAAWLQQQHDSLTWLGGDVYRAHSDRYDYGALSVNAQDIPFRLAAYRPPMDSVLSLGVSDLKEILAWLGYGPSFLQFLGKGWVFALLGGFCVFMAILGMNHRSVKGERRAVLLKSYMFTAGLILCLVPVMALVPIQLASQHLRKSKSLAFSGEYEEANKALHDSIQALPALGFDTGVILQKGYFAHSIGSGYAPELKLFDAVELGKSGLKQQAIHQVLEVLADEACSNEVKREATRLTLHAAIDALNAGKSDQALDLLDHVLNADPACLVAHFHRQLLSVKLGRIELNRSSHARILKIYESFQRKEKKGVIAASWFMLAQGEYADGAIEAASVARRKSKGF